MAFETINLGTQPAGTGGDTARSAFEKTNRNFLAAEVLSAAMSQAQFEAIRAQNKERYAASGWVSFGNHESGKQVNECKPGLYTSLTTPNTLLIGKAGGVGGSKTDHGVLCIAGVIYHLPLAYQVKFAQAPDGKTTYNKSTGVITNYATVAAAFNAQAADPANVEVVINRVDMWGFEAFPQEVTPTNPEIYPHGVFSYLFNSMNGITTSDSARPVSYFGFLGKKAKKVDFFALSDAQKKKVLADPKNNLYYSDDGRLIQWVLRGREFAGAGNGDWLDYEANTQLYSRSFAFADGKNYVFTQASSDLVLSSPHYYDSTLHASNSYPERGAYSARVINEYSANAECYFIVCGTVNRLSQGAYHPSFNPSGAALFTGGNPWHIADVPNTLFCFTNNVPGSLSNGYSGRPDIGGRYYDAIYASGFGGVCRDMRYLANGVDLVDFAEADQRVKNGTYCGFEFGRITKVISFVTSSSETASNYGRVPMTRAEALRVCGLIGVSTEGPTIFHQAKMAVSLYNPNNGKVIHSSAILAAQGNSNFGTYLDPANPSAIWLGFDQKVVENSLAGNQVLMVAGDTGSADSNIFCSSGQTLYAIVTTLDKVSVGGSFLQTDVIANPVNIPAIPSLANGWKGSWCGAAPDGSSKAFPRIRKALAINNRLYTTNNGASWASAGQEAVGAGNLIANGAIAFNEVSIVTYQAFARQTENAVNAAVYGGDAGVGKVYAQSLYLPEWGCVFGESLCGIVCKNTVVPEGVTQPLIRYLRNPYGEFNVANVNSPKHAALDIVLVPANNSLAVKALDYNVNINQQAFIQYAYTELRHNGTNWGDDGKVTIVDSQATKTDLNGNTVLVGTAKLKEPIGWIKNKV